MAGDLEFRVLGPLEVVRSGAPVAVKRLKERALLALLLLHANEVVSADRMVEALWGAGPPRSALVGLQGLVADLREALGVEAIAERGPGYVLQFEEGALDVQRFERLLDAGARARAAGHPERGAALLAEALALWRGRPLADFNDDEFAQPAIARLGELRLLAREELIEADLALGRHSELMPELVALVEEYPLRERPRSLLMLALHRAGRWADALAVYEDGRRALVEQLGIEPSLALQRLERAIVNHDPSLELAAPARAPLPTGEITLLFTDIEGSTRLLHHLGDGYAEVLLEHRRLLRAAVAEHGGVEVDNQGDAHFCVFARVVDAARAAVEAQRALAAYAWPAGAEVRVRMGLHTGTPTPVEGEYVGIDVHRAARICSAAHGGQVLVSPETSRLLAEDPEAAAAGIRIRELGMHRLKDLAAPLALAQLVADGLASEFPPPRSVEPALLAPVAAPDRSILVAPEAPEALDALLAVARPLARSQAPHELIVNRLLPPPPGKELRATTMELAELRARLLRERIVARTAAFTSSDRAADLVRMATEQNVDLLLADYPSVSLDAGLPEELRRVLEDAPCDVALLIQRPGEPPGPHRAVVVPFGATEHDWAALELAAWIASSVRAPLLLLLLGSAGDLDRRGRDASRTLAIASMMVQGLVGVVAEPLIVSPSAASLVEAASVAGLLVLSFPERWRSDGLGAVRTAAARDADQQVLLVRRGLRPGGLTPPEGLTRFTWTLRSG